MSMLKLMNRFESTACRIATSAPPSVTTMLQKLAKLNLVIYTPYHGAALTAVGRRLALEVLRHHRLVELFLVEALGYSWEEVHVEAEVLEHVLSEQLEARIDARLGHPTVDPHGDPIPSPDGTLPERLCQPLTTYRLNRRGGLYGSPTRIRRICVTWLSWGLSQTWWSPCVRALPLMAHSVLRWVTRSIPLIIAWRAQFSSKEATRKKTSRNLCRV